MSRRGRTRSRSRSTRSDKSRSPTNRRTKTTSRSRSPKRECDDCTEWKRKYDDAKAVVDALQEWMEDHDHNEAFEHALHFKGICQDCWKPNGRCHCVQCAECGETLASKAHGAWFPGEQVWRCKDCCGEDDYRVCQQCGDGFKSEETARPKHKHKSWTCDACRKVKTPTCGRCSSPVAPQLELGKATNEPLHCVKCVDRVLG
jgi:hypothetical protein